LSEEDAQAVALLRLRPMSRSWSARRTRSITSARYSTNASSPPFRTTKKSKALRTASELMVGLTALLFLFVLGFILKRRVLRPVVRLSDVVHRLASRITRLKRPISTRLMRLAIWPRPSASSAKRPGATASGKRARCRLGHPRAAGAHDPAAAGV
jgi:HAMP domain-containing protein